MTYVVECVIRLNMDVWGIYLIGWIIESPICEHEGLGELII